MVSETHLVIDLQEEVKLDVLERTLRKEWLNEDCVGLHISKVGLGASEVVLFGLLASLRTHKLEHDCYEFGLAQSDCF